MPTSFESAITGQRAKASQINQFPGPINALETAVEGLTSELDEMAAALAEKYSADNPPPLPAHTHPQSEITGLTTALAGKSATGHGHVIDDVTGLQAALDSKQGTPLSANDMPQKRSLIASLASGQTVSGTQKLTFDTPSLNDGALTWASNTATATRAMTVQIDLSAYSTANGAAYLTLIIYKNGSLFRYGPSVQALYVATISKSIKLASGDTIEIYANAGSSCALNVSTAGLRELQITEL